MHFQIRPSRSISRVYSAPGSIMPSFEFLSPVFHFCGNFGLHVVDPAEPFRDLPYQLCATCTCSRGWNIPPLSWSEVR